jgi:hypothetical protein
MLRLRGRFNPSAPTFGFYSSLIMCGAPVATAGVLDTVYVLYMCADTTVGPPAH